MKKVKISQACDIKTGKLDANASKENGEYPFYTCAPNPLRIDSFAFDDDVILIAGNNASANFHINRYNGKFNAYQRTYVLTEKQGFNLSFVYYALKLELKNLKRRSQGSQTKFLTMPLLSNIEIPELPESIQSSTARIFELLDEKIAALNAKRILIEEFIENVYNYWFVQFEFPTTDGNSYRSSGGRINESILLPGGLPEGWEPLRLDTRLKFDKGFEPGKSSYSDEQFPGYVPYYRVGDMEGISRTFIDSKLPGIVLAKPSDVLVSFDGSVGKILYGMNGSYSSALRNITDKKGIFSAGLIYSLFKSRDIQNTISQYATGSVLLHASGSIEYLQIAFNQDIYAKYQKVVDPHFNSLLSIVEEVATLEEFRDWLMPYVYEKSISLHI